MDFMIKLESPKWKKQGKAIKATQIAFELEQKLARNIKEKAAREGLTPSDEIRKIVGLSYSLPKRPRLTMSLSEDDYRILALKYGLNPEERLEIKRKIMEELINKVEAI